MRTHLHRNNTGYTLVEVLVVVAIIGVLASIAAPTLFGFVTRSTMRSISSDFTTALQRTRMEAVNRNMCATMCMTSTASNSAPVCLDSGADWGRGWIVFLNPTCDSPSAVTTPVPGNIVLVRETSGARYSLNTTASTPQQRITFNSRGTPRLNQTGGFNLTDTEAPTSDANINRTVCLSPVGQVHVLESLSACP